MGQTASVREILPLIYSFIGVKRPRFLVIWNYGSQKASVLSTCFCRSAEVKMSSGGIFSFFLNFSNQPSWTLENDDIFSLFLRLCLMGLTVGEETATCWLRAKVITLLH